MKNSIWLVLTLAFFGLARAQMPLPHTVSIEYRSGGDYRWKGYMGTTDVRDSMTYTLLPDKKGYRADSSFHQDHRFIFQDGERVDLSELPEWTGNGNFIDSTTIRYLMMVLDTRNYEKYDVSDQFSSKGKIPEWQSRVYKHKDYGMEDYGLNEKNKICLCEYYKQRIREQELTARFSYSCEDTARFRTSFQNWLKANIYLSIQTGYYTGIYVSLYFNNAEIKISQLYSGNYNVTWNFINTGKANHIVLSPRINLAVYQLLPPSFGVKERLMEYRELYDMYKQILIRE